MYIGDLSRRDRFAPIIAVVAIHAALLFMLLGLSGDLAPGAVESAIKLIDVTPPTPLTPPPQPPPPREKTKPASAKPKAAAPPAKKAQATPIVAPKPTIELPAPSPVAAASKPAQGAAPSQGAATAGTGNGAGGMGNGTGGGGNGNGSGGNGDDGTGTHPRPLFRPLNPRGFPRALVEPLPPGARVLILFTVQLDGTVSDCSIRQSSGSAGLDALVCQVATQHFRYDPARHGDGRPYVAKAAYMQVF